MQSIDTNSIDMVCCDMPYGTTRCKWDTVIDLMLMWEQYKRICKDNAAIVLFAQTPFDKVLGVSNLEWLRYEIIWEKTAATGHLNAKKMPMKAHENILVFYKKLPMYNPQKTTDHVRKQSKTGKTYSSTCYGNESAKPFYDSTERYPRSVQVFANDKQKNNLHPAQKPAALIEWLVKTYTKKGRVVLDNCMGSGTTAEVCKILGRDFIGIELQEKYFNIASRRVSYHG
jgi:site-specific DNA-methyltransferase (adenine-specific)